MSIPTSQERGPWAALMEVCKQDKQFPLHPQNFLLLNLRFGGRSTEPVPIRN